MTLWRWLWGDGPEKRPIQAASFTATGVASTQPGLIKNGFERRASRAA